ncbi:MAG: hypothetical protein ACRDCE_10990 [Cetobacterium sp.]|uniref:hypothetical protein n=1 Tax=Cetobacterium TaxID=180162 RepID=UPI001F0627D0|nr:MULTISPECIES: hypothetical protein [Cetobacterium]MCX3066029.1 hypothetical protein [Cetobacterium somerae]UPO96514.1 hypothetical protein MKD34_04945 [Cetobacterium somerae]
MYLAIFVWQDLKTNEFGCEFKLSENLESIKKFSLEMAKIELEEEFLKEDLINKMDDLGNWSTSFSKVDVYEVDWLHKSDN